MANPSPNKHIDVNLFKRKSTLNIKMGAPSYAGDVPGAFYSSFKPYQP
jgi:hypothetical protein